RRRHTRSKRDWSSDVCSSDLRVLATKSTTDYYRELMLLCARLSDGHTNVYAPPQSDINAKPPLRTGLIEGKVVIQEVRSPTLERSEERRVGKECGCGSGAEQ